MKKKILFTVLLMWFPVLIALYFTFNTKETFENILSLGPLGIPQIIHQTAPADTTKWPPVWHSCQKSWKKYFPTYQYMMWTDEDLDNLIKTDFPEYWGMFQGYDKKIKKIDIARYFILHKYGGIYADMDYECFQNFENLIPKNKVSISESPYQNEYLQNALMISPKGYPFWSKVIEKAKSRAGTTSDKNNSNNNNNNNSKNNNVLYQTGPQLVSDTYFENTSMVNVLPKDLWNPDKALPFNSKLICRHLGTYSWA
jgi:mannosyltransferase OCH1-like enzyme